MLCLGIASVLFFSYKASAGQHVFNPIIAWALVPYLVALIAALLPQGPSGTFGVLLGCMLFVVGSAWAYYDAFFIHTDAQNGLVFVFFPAIQLVGSVVLVVCARHRLHRIRTQKPHPCGLTTRSSEQRLAAGSFPWFESVLASLCR